MEIIRPVPVTAGVLVSTTAIEDAATWTAGTYALGNTVDHEDHVWESLVNSNTAEPGTDDTKWLDLGANNIWRMFDQAVNSQTVADDEIEVVLEAPTAVDMVFLQNLAGAEVQVVVTDTVDGVVYNQTRSLVADGFIDNWLSYFTEGFARNTEALFTDLPALYVGAPITVTIRETGEEVACGLCIIGQSLEMGGTRWDVETGIDDYSVKTTDDFGNVTVLERAFNKRARFSIWAATDRVAFLQNTMAGYRATPLVFIGSRDHPSTWIYGFYNAMGFVIAYPDVSNFDLEVKGLA